MSGLTAQRALSVPERALCELLDGTWEARELVREHGLHPQLAVDALRWFSRCDYCQRERRWRYTGVTRPGFDFRV